MSETDSDESIDTQDLNEILETKKETVGGVERSSPKKEKNKVKTKKIKTEKDLGEVKEKVEEVKEKVKKPRTQAQIDATKKLLEANRIRRENNKKEKKVEEVKEVQKVKEKKPKTNTKKEKVIYMIENDKGGYDEVSNPPPLSKRELKKIELEEQAKKEELELGKKLIRRKTGAIDKRSKNTRTEKQIENAKKLVAFNKKRREDNKKQSEENKKKEQEYLNKVIKDTVTDTVVDVVSKPISQIKQERKERKNIITDEELKQYEFSKKKSLFS